MRLVEVKRNRFVVYAENGKVVVQTSDLKVARSFLNAKAKYDLNDNGKIDPDERDIMLEDRRRMMEDADAKRDAQLRMTWFALSGMVLFPFGVSFTDLGATRASIYLTCRYSCGVCGCVSGVTAAYFGFTNMGANK